MVTFVLLPVFGNVTKNRHIQSCLLESDHLPSHKMGRKTVTNKCDGFSGMLQLFVIKFMWVWGGGGRSDLCYNQDYDVIR